MFLVSEWWGAGMVICLECSADLHIAQLMPLPLTVSCCSKIQIGFTFLVLAHLGSPGQRAVKRVCVCVSPSYPSYQSRAIKYLFTHHLVQKYKILVYLNSWLYFYADLLYK